MTATSTEHRTPSPFLRYWRQSGFDGDKNKKSDATPILHITCLLIPSSSYPLHKCPTSPPLRHMWHAHLPYMVISHDLGQWQMSYASPTLTPAITDLPYMVISRLRATAHCPKCGHGFIYSVNKLWIYRGSIQNIFKLKFNVYTLNIFKIYSSICFCFKYSVLIFRIYSIHFERKIYALKFNR